MYTTGRYLRYCLSLPSFCLWVDPPTWRERLERGAICSKFREFQGCSLLHIGSGAGMEASKKKKISYKVISCPLPSCLSPQLAAGAPSITNLISLTATTLFSLFFSFLFFLSPSSLLPLLLPHSRSSLPHPRRHPLSIRKSSSSSFLVHISLALSSYFLLLLPLCIFRASHISRIHSFFLSQARYFASQPCCLPCLWLGTHIVNPPPPHSAFCPTLPSSPIESASASGLFLSLYQSSTCNPALSPPIPPTTWLYASTSPPV